MALVAHVEKGTIVETKKTEDEKATGNDLGYDQFLQLLCAEMQYQDPLEPTSNTEYVAQLATFSQMEATLGMQSTIEHDSASGLVGKYVIVKATSSTTGETTAQAGFVDYVQYENGEPTLYVNGKGYTLDEVYQVADTDYMEAVTIAEAFKASIAKMPSADNLGISDKEDLEKISTVYDSLNAYQKSAIDSDTMKKYNELLAKMKELTAESGGDSDGGKEEGGTDGDKDGESTGKTE